MVAVGFVAYCLYLDFVAHPARKLLHGSAAVLAWRRAYWRDFVMQCGLALVGGGAGLWQWHLHNHASWLAGGLLLLGTLPYRFSVLAPTRRLLMTRGIEATARAAPLLAQWNRLSMGLTWLGLLAVLALLAGALGLHYGRY